MWSTLLMASRAGGKGSELAAIDRVLEAQGTALGGAGVSGPGTEALTSSGLIALGAQRRNAEEAGYPAM